MNIRPREEILAVLQDAFSVQGKAGCYIRVPWGKSMLDNRDLDRLLTYVTFEEAQAIFSDRLKPENAEEWGKVKPWDEETITAHARNSLAFAFEKALGQRGISASLMHTVMKMWMWVIQDDELLDMAWYANYGLAYLYQIRDKHFPDLRPEL